MPLIVGGHISILVEKMSKMAIFGDKCKGFEKLKDMKP